MKISEKLINRLKNDFPELLINDTAKYERLYPGHIQRFSGAWSWHIVNNGAGSIGSQWRIVELLKSEIIEYSFMNGDTSLFPIYNHKHT